MHRLTAPKNLSGALHSLAETHTGCEESHEDEVELTGDAAWDTHNLLAALVKKNNLKTTKGSKSGKGDGGGKNNYERPKRKCFN